MAMFCIRAAAAKLKMKLSTVRRGRYYDKSTWICCTDVVVELYYVIKYSTIRNVNKNRKQNYILETS